MNKPTTLPIDRLERLEARFVRALDVLETASPIGKGLHQNHVFEMTLRILHEPGGVEALYRYAPRFDTAGVFHASDWAKPGRLRPEFVAGALHQKGLTLAAECLSELRFLAIVRGDAQHPDVTPTMARTFLDRAVGFNLDLLFPEATESSRITRETAPELMEGVRRLFRFIVDTTGPDGILDSIVREAERILRQRPVSVRRVRTILGTAADTLAAGGETPASPRALVLINALLGPTELSREAPTSEAYVAHLFTLDDPALVAEAQACGDAMWATGLVSAPHAALVRYLNEHRPDLLPHALRLESVGTGTLALHGVLVRDLIRMAVYPETAQCVYGLANLLVSGDLLFPPLAPSLHRLMAIRLSPVVEEALPRLLHWEAPDHQIPARSILLAGTLSVLGQPLGIGQGDNPTCQSARAISLWSQVDAGYLLELLAQAARDDSITMHFEGQTIRSADLPHGIAADLHTDLDPVSLVLVPHLDRVYAEMSRLVATRGDDPHRWINPEFHGWWVYRGFALAVDVPTQQITGFEQFTRLFYASYHPDYRGEAELIYPQPIGIAATDHSGAFLGWHAISIQRVVPSADGMRVYFYNPNNDGGQDWGQGIVTSTGDHNELAGEASLPFEQFAARVYLFHYNLREHGDPALVPADLVAQVIDAAASSWGAAFPWAATS